MAKQQTLQHGTGWYAFAQKANETVEQAVVRAAQTVISSGINEIAHYKGTNHVMADNAAFAFPDELLAELKGSEDSSEEVVAAAELLEVRKQQTAHRNEADKLDKAASVRSGQGKNMAFAFAFAKAAAHAQREKVSECHEEMKRIAQFVPKPKA